MAIYKNIKSEGRRTSLISTFLMRPSRSPNPNALFHLRCPSFSGTSAVRPLPFGICLPASVRTEEVDCGGLIFVPPAGDLFLHGVAQIGQHLTKTMKAPEPV